MSTPQHAKIYPASTIIILRRATPGFEVLLLRRAKAIKFAGGTWVFPGGRIEESDSIDGNTFSLAAARAAAVRECYEEAGLQLAPDSMIYYSHWTTPTNYSKRFATWFLLDVVDSDKEITIDDGEIVDYLWLTPADAIAARHEGQLKMMPPTYLSLLELSQCETIDEALKFASHREAPVITPFSVKKENYSCLLYPEDIAYESGDLNLSGPQHRIVFNETDWDYVKKGLSG